VLAIAGCGGGDSGEKAEPASFAWKGKPILRISPEGARVLIGTVHNGFTRTLRIRAPSVRVVDQRGRRMKASVAFVSSFVRSTLPQNGRPGSRRSEFPETEQRRIGYLAMLYPGNTLPLTVSWNEPRGRRAERILTPAGGLPIPSAAIDGR
jgi:hypothetical protein